MNRFVDPDPPLLSDEVNAKTNPKFHALNEAIVRLVGVHLFSLYPQLKRCIRRQIEDYNMVQFIPLDLSDPESINFVLSHIDNAIQYGESEVRLIVCSLPR